MNPPINMFLIAGLLLISQILFWVQHAELNAELLRLSKIFIFAFLCVLCDVGYFFFAQPHTVDIPRWSVMRISSFFRVEPIFRGLLLC